MNKGRERKKWRRTKWEKDVTVARVDSILSDFEAPREIRIKQNDPRLLCPRKRPLPFLSVFYVRATNIYGHLARRSRGVYKLEVNPSVGLSYVKSCSLLATWCCFALLTCKSTVRLCEECFSPVVSSVESPGGAEDERLYSKVWFTSHASCGFRIVFLFLFVWKFIKNSLFKNLLHITRIFPNY